MQAAYLSTKDNPFNPFTQFEDWYAFDVMHGYNSCAYLARIAKTSPDLSAEQNVEAINSAIDEILYYDLTGNYVRIEEKPPVEGS